MNYLITLFTAVIVSTVSCGESEPGPHPWLGTFTVKQQCDGAATPGYQMKVSQTAEDTTQLTLDNVGGYGKKVNAVLEGDTLILTPTHASVGLMGKVRLSGSGTRQDETLVIDLKVEVPGPQGTATQSQCQLRATPVVK